MLSPCFRAANFLRRVRTTPFLRTEHSQNARQCGGTRLSLPSTASRVVGLPFFLCSLLGRFQLLPQASHCGF